MGIFSRLSDIVNSNINSMLDHAEDPHKIIRLVIQEMEDTLVEVRSSAVRTIAERRDLDRRVAAIRREEDEWERKAELALTHNREDLARGALLAKSHRAEERDGCERQLAVLVESLAQMDEDIGKLQAKLAEAKRREQTLATRRDTARSRIKLRERIHDERVNDAFARFEQAERALDRLEGRVESYDLGREVGSPLEKELAQLQGGQVDDDLRKLRERMARTAPASDA